MALVSQTLRIEVLFSKKKFNDLTYEANLWFEELHETINYLKRLEKFLNKLDYKKPQRKHLYN